MSTQGQPAASWREEVNRRLAEHKNRKGNPSAASAPAQPAAPGSSRAAQAAARVAARFAKAPSYTQIQAEEARIAVRAAEIATQVAIQAQSAAETALAGLHAATVEAPPPAEPAQLIPFETAARLVEAEPAVELKIAEPEVVEPDAVEPEVQAAPAAAPEWDWADDALVSGTRVAASEPVAVAASLPAAAPVVAAAPEPVLPAVEIPAGPVTDAKASSGQLLQIRWEPDMPLRPAKAEPESFELTSEDWWTAAEPASHQDLQGRESAGRESQNRGEPVEVEAHTIQANLIEFPRELVATRRIRPRNVEGPAVEPGAQLSIFEVDPGSIQTEAPALVDPAWAAAEPLAAAAATDRTDGAQAAVSGSKEDWSAPEWSGMKLGAHPRVESAPVLANKLSLAPLTTRLMAGLVDGSVAVAVATFLWLTLALGRSQMLTPRNAELMGVGALAFAALAYHAFFCLISMPTLGMRYARLSLCTFDEMIPTAPQHRRRFGAMVLSMLPLGLGMAWSLFDEDHLAWHDRYSQTYLRRN